MTIRNLRFVCAQPANLYYAWQVELMINNFMEMGINPNLIDVVCWKDSQSPMDLWSKLANKYPARFFFYEDTRITRHYVSSIRPNILKQHWLNYPELKGDAIFYHDCDIIFTKPVKEWITEEMINDWNWYGSDTRWYIAHSYIKSKGQDIIDTMCSLMHMEESIIESNELNAIGAQYLMKHVDWEFWNRVESDCEILFKDITAINNEKKRIDPSYHELQIWCADMWAVLWGAWRRGDKTICHPNFDFSWATSGLNDYNKMNIMHNAGVTDGNSGLFYKAQWMKELPFNKNLTIREDSASWYYYNEIKKLETKSVLL